MRNMEPKETAWDKFVRWFSIVICILSLLNLATRLWMFSPIAFLAVISLISWCVFDYQREERRKQRDGWWVETISPVQLRSAPGRWAVVYHELKDSAWFAGQEQSDGTVYVHIPPEEDWVQSTLPWAWPKRDLIVARVRARIPRSFVIEEV